MTCLACVRIAWYKVKKCCSKNDLETPLLREVTAFEFTKEPIVTDEFNNSQQYIYVTHNKLEKEMVVKIISLPETKCLACRGGGVFCSKCIPMDSIKE